MTSLDIREIGNWQAWCANTLSYAPECMGIYVFRLENGKAIQRLVGESDILYIGKAVKRGIKARLRDRVKDDLPLERITKTVAAVEVGWMRLVTEHEVCLWESELIARYERDHIELPPLNRTQPWQGLQRRKMYLKSLGTTGDEMLRVAKEHGHPFDIDE